jgi:2'-5' RNA ligase
VAVLGRSPRRFERSAWPLHVTLLGNFRARPGSLNQVRSVSDDIAETTPPIRIVAGEYAQFGDDGSIPVRLVAAPLAHELHRVLLERLAPLVDLARPDQAGDSYQPHVTSWGSRVLPDGVSLLASIRLVRLRDGLAEVVDTYRLRGRA